MEDTKFSDLDPVTAVASPDFVAVVQGGVSKRADVSLFSSFLSRTIVRVDPSGNDGTGIIGDLAKPFLTVQAAITAIEALAPIPDWPVIDIGNNQFLEGVTTSLDSVAFVGRRTNTDLGITDNSPFQSLTFNASVSQQAAFLKDCSARESIITFNAPNALLHLSQALTGTVKNVAASGSIMDIYGYGNSFVDSVQDTIGGAAIRLHELSLAPDGQIFGQSDTVWNLYNCVGVKFLPSECASFTVENTPLLISAPPDIPISVTYPKFLPVTNSAGNATILGLCSKNGVPGVGFTGFEKGSICMDTANGKLYVNGGDAATPDWKLVVSAP